ncbi:hypothetical protein WG66_015743 [Moniliophthora roreri]|nr:hypothetical protein WG66_015743 [Moniliophthora roreri]
MFSSRRNIGVGTRAVGSTFGFKGQPSASYVSPSLVVTGSCERPLRRIFGSRYSPLYKSRDAPAAEEMDENGF